MAGAAVSFVDFFVDSAAALFSPKEIPSSASKEVDGMEDVRLGGLDVGILQVESSRRLIAAAFALLPVLFFSVFPPLETSLLDACSLVIFRVMLGLQNEQKLLDTRMHVSSTG